MAARAALNAGGEALRMRGIYEQALLHKWKWSRGGWEYPLFTATGTEMRPAVRRFKRLGLVAPRYLWLTSKSDQTGYYFAPSSTIKQQVAEQDGVLYVANGEPSTLSFRAAGMPNVVSWFGELNVPDTFADDCLKWGVKEVVNYPDPDPTGHRASQKLHDMFSRSPIRYTAFQIPLVDEGKKEDINDVWRRAKFDVERFRAALSRMAPLDHRTTPDPPEDPAASPPAAVRTPPPAKLFLGDVTALKDQVEAALGLDPDTLYNGTGWARVGVRCLATNHGHDHVRPAAYWNRDGSLLYCFKCNRTLRLLECATRLGLLLPTPP